MERIRVEEVVTISPSPKPKEPPSCPSPLLIVREPHRPPSPQIVVIEPKREVREEVVVGVPVDAERRRTCVEEEISLGIESSGRGRGLMTVAEFDRTVETVEGRSEEKMVIGEKGKGRAGCGYECRCVGVCVQVEVEREKKRKERQRACELIEKEKEVERLLEEARREEARREEARREEAYREGRSRSRHSRTRRHRRKRSWTRVRGGPEKGSDSCAARVPDESVERRVEALEGRTEGLERRVDEEEERSKTRDRKIRVLLWEFREGERGAIIRGLERSGWRRRRGMVQSSEGGSCDSGRARRHRG